jgi:DNA-binding MarR family transcriptional regulator
MTPDRDDVQSMVAALFTMNAGIERARRQRKGAATLSLLQVIAGREAVRPSEIADLQQVHPSLVTRQIRELEDAGYIQVTADPADGRSYLVALAPAGTAELLRLTQVGLDRFALFVADWEPADVRTLAALLEQLVESAAAVTAREQRPAGRRLARQRPRPGQQTELSSDSGLSEKGSRIKSEDFA